MTQQRKRHEHVAFGVEGLIERLLGPEGGKYLDEFCLYVMPMANKDGVAAGWTRF